MVNYEFVYLLKTENIYSWLLVFQLSKLELIPYILLIGVQYHHYLFYLSISTGTVLIEQRRRHNNKIHLLSK